MPKKPPTKAEKAHMGRVAALGCLVCLNEGLGQSPACVHHIEPWKGRNHFKTIGLCPTHHQYSANGEIAIHAGRESFEARYGTEAELLAQVQEMLG